ncbi:MAG: hypothetical protein AVDCRST_MAG67-4, partial [uncultured Solirubrobacteraceae bacterium]
GSRSRWGQADGARDPQRVLDDADRRPVRRRDGAAGARRRPDRAARVPGPRAKPLRGGRRRPARRLRADLRAHPRLRHRGRARHDERRRRDGRRRGHADRAARTRQRRLRRRRQAPPQRRAPRLRARARRPRVEGHEGRQGEPRGHSGAGGRVRRVPRPRSEGRRAGGELQPGPLQARRRRLRTARAAEHRGSGPSDDAARARRHRHRAAADPRIPPGAFERRLARLHGSARGDRHVGVPADARAQLSVRGRDLGEQRPAQARPPGLVLGQGAALPAGGRRPARRAEAERSAGQLELQRVRDARHALLRARRHPHAGRAQGPRQMRRRRRLVRRVSLPRRGRHGEAGRRHVPGPVARAAGDDRRREVRAGWRRTRRPAAGRQPRGVRVAGCQAGGRDAHRGLLDLRQRCEQRSRDEAPGPPRLGPRAARDPRASCARAQGPRRSLPLPQIQISPSRTANATACVRLRAPSFV